MRDLLSSKKLLVPILLFLGIGGFVGGISFITKPDGSGLGMTTDFLARSPVDNYFWPGIFLLVFMGGWPFINIYGLLTRQRWYKASLLLLGIVSMTWIVYETIVIRTFSPLQPTVFIIGLLLALSALPTRQSSE